MSENVHLQTIEDSRNQQMTPYYDSGGIQIFHGECEQVMPLLGSFDLLCTDPPYGIGEDSDKSRKRGTAMTGGVDYVRDYGDITWDKKPVAAETMDLARSKAKWQIIFGGNYYTLPPTSCWLIWDKENSGDFADGEMAWTNLKKAMRIKRHLWNGMIRKYREPRYHPTQKPLDIMRWVILQAPDDITTILDPWCGSGTTLVAAKELGKQAVGIDREEKWCEIAAMRLSQEVMPFS